MILWKNSENIYQELEVITRREISLSQRLFRLEVPYEFIKLFLEMELIPYVLVCRKKMETFLNLLLNLRTYWSKTFLH